MGVQTRQTHLHAFGHVPIRVVVGHGYGILVGERPVEVGRRLLPHRLDDVARHPMVHDRHEAHLAAGTVPLLGHLLLSGFAALEEGLERDDGDPPRRLTHLCALLAHLRELVLDASRLCR